MSNDPVVTIPTCLQPDPRPAPPPPVRTVDEALAAALREANAFGRRLYAEPSQRDHFAPLSDFDFVPDEDAYVIKANKRQKQGIAPWSTMAIDQDSNPCRVATIGHTERIDALAVLLSYLALRRGTPLSYQIPVLKETLTADANGVLSLSG